MREVTEQEEIKDCVRNGYGSNNKTGAIIYASRCKFSMDAHVKRRSRVDGVPRQTRNYHNICVILRLSRAVQSKINLQA